MDFHTLMAMISANEVKLWLKEHGKTHAWLADQIYMSRHTVTGWLSNGKAIPALRQDHIEDVLHAYEKGRAGEGCCGNCLELVLDEDTFDQWNAAASREGKLIRQWAIDSLNLIAQKIR